MRKGVLRQAVGNLAAGSFGESKTQFRVCPSVLGSALVGDRRGHAGRRESETRFVVKSGLNLQKVLGDTVLTCKLALWAESTAQWWSACCLQACARI